MTRRSGRKRQRKSENVKSRSTSSKKKRKTSSTTFAQTVLLSGGRGRRKRKQSPVENVRAAKRRQIEQRKREKVQQLLKKNGGSTTPVSTGNVSSTPSSRRKSSRKSGRKIAKSPRTGALKKVTKKKSPRRVSPRKNPPKQRIQQEEKKTSSSSSSTKPILKKISDATTSVFTALGKVCFLALLVGFLRENYFKDASDSLPKLREEVPFQVNGVSKCSNGFTLNRARGLCLENSCDQIVKVAKGTEPGANCLGGGVTTKPVCAFECAEGYQMIGASHIGCNMSGVWDTAPTCFFSEEIEPLDVPIVGNFDGEGKLSTISEVETALGAHGIKGSVTFLSSFFHSADKNDDGHLNQAELLDGIRDVSTSSNNDGESSMFVKVAFVLGSVIAGAFYSTAPPANKSNTPNVKCSVFRNALKKKEDDESVTCSVVAVPAQSVTGTSPIYLTPQQPIRKYSSLQTSGGSNYTTPSAPPMPIDLLGDDPNSSNMY